MIDCALIRRLIAACFALWFIAWGPLAYSQGTDCPELKSFPGQRLVVAISDLHFGQGRDSRGRWFAQEDFRWSGAFQGFLDRISICSGEMVDLVITGDLLELWQPPTRLKCKSKYKELGCTPKELSAITRSVVRAHSGDFAALGRFADRGANHVHIIPGNHDAALMLAEPWSIVESAIGSQKGRATKVGTGIWIGGSEGTVVIEHGHQIGSDVNSYDKWPEITRRFKRQDYVLRPWGEGFVQQLFNEQEESYPVIDNLSPEATGARYRMADRGVWKSVADIARFIAFNLFETSLTQIGQALGKPGESVEWNVPIGRAMGHKLFAEALSVDDPFRQTMTGNTVDAKKLRMELGALALDSKRLPDEEVKLLCGQLAIRTGNGIVCQERTTGALTQSLVRPKEAVMVAHLRERLKKPELAQMRVFIYGHTHQLEKAWPVGVTDLREVTVLNTGAFQRTVDEPTFLGIATEKGWTPTEALQKMSVDDLPACYSAVVVALGAAIPEARTLQWYMKEGEVGRFLDVGETPCPAVRPNGR